MHNTHARIVIMFDAKILHLQGNHFALVVANHVASDSFLLLDCEYGMVWVPWALLESGVLGFISILHIP